jgi:hypothetical protein
MPLLLSLLLSLSLTPRVMMEPSKLVVNPFYPTELKFARDSYFIDHAVNLWYRVNEDLYETARRICIDNSIGPRKLNGRRLTRCYLAMARTLLKHRITAVNGHSNSWRETMSSSFGTNISQPEKLDGLLYSLVVGIDWSLRRPHLNYDGRSQKQICIIGGTFCPQIAYAAALSIPYPFQYELLYVVSSDRTVVPVCDGSSDVDIVRGQLSKMFDQQMTESEILDISKWTEIDIDVITDRMFLQSLIGRELPPEHDAVISCDIIYVRDADTSYVNMILSLLHQYRVAKRSSVRKDVVPIHEADDEIEIIRESSFSFVEEAKLQRTVAEDCRLSHILRAEDAFPSPTNKSFDDVVVVTKTKDVCDSAVPQGHVRHEYHRDGSYGTVNFISSCHGRTDQRNLHRITYSAYTIVPSHAYLSDWEDYQGLSSDSLNDLGSGYAEMHIGASRFISSGLELNAVRQSFRLNSGPASPYELHLRQYGSLCTEPQGRGILDRQQSKFNFGFATLHPTRYNMISPKTIATAKFPMKANSEPERRGVLAIRLLVSYSSRLFEDNAIRLVSQIKTLGGVTGIHGEEVNFTAELVGHSPFLSQLRKVQRVTESMNRKTSPNTDEIYLQFHFGCHNLGHFTTNFICFQTEQPFSFIFNPQSHQYYWTNRLMANALGVAVMSDYHKQHMISRSKQSNTDVTVYIIPFYTEPYPKITWTSSSMIIFLQRAVRASITRNGLVIGYSLDANRLGEHSTPVTLGQRLIVRECSRWFDTRATDGMTWDQIYSLRRGYSQYLIRQHEDATDVDVWSEIGKILAGTIHPAGTDINSGALSRDVAYNSCECPHYGRETIDNFTRFAFQSDHDDEAGIPHLSERFDDIYSCCYYRATGTLKYIEQNALVGFGGHSTKLNKRHSHSLFLEEMPTDIFMYGFCTQRRQEFINAAQSVGADTGMTVGYLCVSGWNTSMFDAELQHFLLASRIVANIHSYPESSLQLHRLQYLFALGKCVISERSDLDRELDDKVARSVVFAKTHEELLNMADVIAHDRYLNLYSRLSVYYSRFRAD